MFRGLSRAAPAVRAGDSPRAFTFTVCASLAASAEWTHACGGNKHRLPRTLCSRQAEEAKRKLEVQMAQEQAALRHSADASSAAALEELNASMLALKARKL